MQIRFLANSKGKSFTILGFESENERAAFFDCLQKSDAFLGDLRQRLDFSSLVKQLESRSAKQIAMDRVAVATPIRGEELTKLLGGIMDILREADAIFREEMKLAGLDRTTSQFFAVLTDLRSVGVMGDERTYDYAVALRAVTTTDFMTAESYDMPWSVLGTVTSRIVNEVKHVNRVFYDCTGKPPATIELE